MRQCLLRGSNPNTVRLAVRAELVEPHSPFDRLRANELKRTALGRIPDGLVEKFSERRHRNADHINTFRRLLPPNLGVILTQNCPTKVSGIV